MKRGPAPVVGASLLVGLCLALPGGPSAAGGSFEFSPAQEAALRRYAKDTWHSMTAMTLTGGLPADGLCRDRAGDWRPSYHTSPTNIAAYLWSVLAAERLRLIGADEADRRLDETLGALARQERDHGFFFNNLDPRTGAREALWPDNNAPVRPFLSTVDNGWLAAALVMVGNTRPALRARTEALLGPMDFRFFYEPYDPANPVKHPGLFRGGYWSDTHRHTTFFYRLVNTEPRVACYVAVARGQIPADHYYRLGRTRRPESRQKQTPEGEERTYLGVRVFEGHYRYRGMRIVPSWGGSMFEALMVPLFVPEARWAPRSWGVNHPLYVRAQMAHGLDEAGYGFWGFSPASKPEGGYASYGVDAIGVDPDGYPSNNDKTRYDPAHPPPRSAYTNGVVTPHASFLALPFAPAEALANLQALRDRFAVYGLYGFHDSVNVSSGVVSDCVLAVDQGMILAAITNALCDNAMQRAFCEGRVEAAIRPLIAPEEFTAGPSLSPAVSDSPVRGEVRGETARTP